MEMLALILGLSTVMWYLIDRLKDAIWGGSAYSKWITIGVSAVAAFGLTFAYGIDLIYATGLFAEPTIAGELITGFSLMAGSSGVSELIEAIKGKN